MVGPVDSGGTAGVGSGRSDGWLLAAVVAGRRPRQQAEGGGGADAGLVTDADRGVEMAAGGLDPAAGVDGDRRTAAATAPRPVARRPRHRAAVGRHRHREPGRVPPDGGQDARRDRLRVRPAARRAVGVAGAKAQDWGASTATVTVAAQRRLQGPDPVEVGQRMVEAPRRRRRVEGGQRAVLGVPAAPAGHGRAGVAGGADDSLPLAPQAASSTTTPARATILMLVWTPTAPLPVPARR